MNYVDVIKHLQIETTTYCNSFCPGCSRNINGGELNPHIELEHMNIDTWKKLFEEGIIKSLSLNGTFGDPLMTPSIIPMLKELADMNVIDDMVSVHTNGGMRSEKFWYDLSKVLQRFKKHEVVFGIDGLADTHSIHRRGTDFNKVINNAKIYIEAGATATWRMIVFDHNVHQVADCKELARELGFKYFSLKPSYDKTLYAKKYKQLPEATLTRPATKVFNELLKYEENFYRMSNHFQPGEYKTEEFNNPKDCPWLHNLSLQVDAKGRVWPCCYISDDGNNKVKQTMWSLNSLYKKFSEDFNNINKHSLKEILSHKFFTKHMDNVWNKKSSQLCEWCVNRDLTFYKAKA